MERVVPGDEKGTQGEQEWEVGEDFSWGALKVQPQALHSSPPTLSKPMLLLCLYGQLPLKCAPHIQVPTWYLH